MRVFPSTKQGGNEHTPAEQLYWEAIEQDLVDENTLPACDLTDCDKDDLDDEFEPDKGNNHAVDTEAYQTTINTSKYKKAKIDQVVQSCTHLSQEQQN